MTLLLWCASALAAPKLSLVLGENDADNEPVGDFTPSGDAASDATYEFYEDLTLSQVTQDFVLRNDGDEDLVLSGAQVWDDQELTLKLGDCAGDLTLAPGVSCSFSLTVLSGSANPGAYSGRLELLTNIEGEETWSFEGTYEKAAESGGCSAVGSLAGSSGGPLVGFLVAGLLLLRRRGQRAEGRALRAGCRAPRHG